MKCSLFTLIVLLIGCCISHAQSPALYKRPKPFKAMIWTNKYFNKGFLKSINDSSLQLSQMRIPFTNNEALKVPGTIYHYMDVEQVKVWRYGKVGRGIGFGALTGMGLGAITGLISYRKDPNAFIDFGPGFSALAGALVGAIPGAIFGTVIGTQKLKFNINRNKSNFNDMRKVVFEKAL